MPNKMWNLYRLLNRNKLPLHKQPIERFVMHRFGMIETALVAANQCKDTGHSHYEYLVKITCFNKLDANGFLIDNKEVNRVMRAGLKQMMSCEMLCIHFAQELEQLFKDHSVPVCEMYVSLKPVIPGAEYKDYAEFEFFRDYQHDKL